MKNEQEILSKEFLVKEIIYKRDIEIVQSKCGEEVCGGDG